MMGNIFKNKSLHREAQAKRERSGGITLFIAIVIMSILLLVSFAAVNIAIKGTLFAVSGKDSQTAFYAADAGAECALYWDNTTDAFNIGYGATWAEVHMMEFSNVDPASFVDAIAMQSGSTGPAAPVNITSGLATTHSSRDLIIGYTDQWYWTRGDVTGDGVDDTVSPGSGFTKFGAEFSDAVEYKNVTSAGSYEADFSIPVTNGNSGSWGALMGAFRAKVGETPALVQHKANNNSLGQAIAFNSSSNNGDLIVVTFQYDTYSFRIDSVTDNKGNSYSRAVGPLLFSASGSPRAMEMWYAFNGAASGGSNIQITAHSPAFIPQTISCNGTALSTGNSLTGTTTTARIGGGGSANPMSVFSFSLNTTSNPTSACAVVTVTKLNDGTTSISSHGYNTCTLGFPRRVERGVEVTY